MDNRRVANVNIKSYNKEFHASCRNRKEFNALRVVMNALEIEDISKRVGLHPLWDSMMALSRL
jgi:hypothetical protein